MDKRVKEIIGNAEIVAVKEGLGKATSLIHPDQNPSLLGRLAAG